MGRVAIALALLMLAGGAGAQALDPAVDVEAAAERVSVRWDAAQTVSWTVANTGPVAGTVGVAAEAGDDWDVALQGPASFQLAAGASRAVTAEVAAVGVLNASRAEAPIALTATLTDGGGRSHSDSAQTTMTFVPQPVPPPPPPPPAPEPLVWPYVAGLLVLLAAGAYAAGGFLFGIEARAAPAVLAGKPHWLHVDVINKAPWSQRFDVRVTAPDSLRAILDADHLNVRGRRSAVATVHVRPRDEGPHQSFLVRVRRSAIYPWRSVRLSIAVRDPDPDPWAVEKAAPEVPEPAPVQEQALAPPE